jgi:glucose-1-phosphate thymidylyltransferase
MKALITAGGRATRLRPLTFTINKHLIPLANRPMLWHALDKIAAAGITEVAINVNAGDTEIAQSVGDGSRWGVRVTYLEQAGGPLGLAHILHNAKAWVGEDDLLFYLGDNIILGDIAHLVETFYAEECDGLLSLARCKDPSRFGVPVLEGGRVMSVVEKPKDPPSPYAVAGIYLYRPSIFRAIAELRPSPRGEYEISDAHTRLIAQGGRVGWREITGWWKDTGMPEDLIEGNALILDQLKESKIDPAAEVHPDARLQGVVQVAAGAKIGKDVLIRGPAVVGEGCRIDRAYVGPYTSLGAKVEVDDAEIEHAVVMDGAKIGGGQRLVDSLIGREATVGAMDARRPRGVKLVVGDRSSVEM